MNRNVTGGKNRLAACIAATGAGLLLALLATLPGQAFAQGGIDPMRVADPVEPYRSLPDVAPLRGGILSPVPVDAAGQAGASRAGVTAPRSPRVGGIACLTRCISVNKATRGGVIRVTGTYLGDVTRVLFRGRKGAVRAKVSSRTGAAVRVVVPKGAVQGRLAVVNRFGLRSNRSARALKLGPASAIPREVFPIRGAYNFGSSGSRFGSGRPGHTHQGQDVGSPCGTRLVSVRRGRVTYNAYQGGGAGNYVVIKNAGTNTSYVYMHMLRRSSLKVGTAVGAGAVIGRVGNTGASFGCHLHFEYWIGPWQRGGKPIDPLPYLRSLRGK